MKNMAVIDGKNHTERDSEFKRRLSSAMSFLMSRHFLFIIAAFVLIGLAACSKPEEEHASETAPVVTTQEEPVIAEETAAADANAERDLLESMRENSGILSKEEQAAMAERARENAKNAALAVGQTEQEADNAGRAAFEAAERSAEARQEN